ncbi:MAG TPA: hypothetical protein PK335_01220 [Draconibacterium sp.]|nr:hypothetical protein [Draconibacterium sp.]
MKCKTVFIVAIILIVILFVYKTMDKKQVVYIKFEDLKGYSYHFVKDSLGQDKCIRLSQEGKFDYISWELDIERDKVQKLDFSFIDEVDVVSQYWIINNFSGIQIEFDPEKSSDYDIYALKLNGDSILLYPISFLHYIIE